MSKTEKSYSFVLYGRRSCPYCRLADELIKKIKRNNKNVTYRFIEIEKERNRKILENDTIIPKSYLTVPKIKVNNKFIGGSDDLAVYSKKTFNL
jgi:glutaredoxin